MYDNICPIMLEVESVKTIEECETSLDGTPKYGMRLVL